MSKLIKVAETKDVSPGTGKVVQAEGRSIVVFNVAGTFHAIDNTCSQDGGPLGEDFTSIRCLLLTSWVV